MRPTKILFSITLALCFVTTAAFAQEPKATPMVVEAATPPPAVLPTAPPPDSGSIQEALKALQELKATNEETLKRQEATLQQLDDLQKAADQIKVFASRL